MSLNGISKQGTYSNKPLNQAFTTGGTLIEGVPGGDNNLFSRMSSVYRFIPSIKEQRSLSDMKDKIPKVEESRMNFSNQKLDYYEQTEVIVEEPEHE